MNSEQEATKKIGQYQELAKGNKQIDIAALMISALDQSRQEEIAAKKKRWAYLISVCLPPLGLLMAVRYWSVGTEDGKRVAKTCLILTVAAALVAWGIGALIFGSLGSGAAEQLQNVKPADVNALFQGLTD